jgi:hypothetical protein
MSCCIPDTTSLFVSPSTLVCCVTNGVRLCRSSPTGDGAPLIFGTARCSSLVHSSDVRRVA